MDVLSIPTIDIAPFIGGSVSDKHQVAAAVGHACEQTGFLTITGHGVPMSLIETMNITSRQFFHLPLTAKMQVRAASGRGYISLGAENLAATLNAAAPGDLKETFNIGSYLEDNIWPNSLPNLKLTCLDYFHELEHLAATLMQIFAVALDLPEYYFDNFINPPNAVLRLANYPGQDKDPLPGQLRAGEHTDYGTLTIVWPESVSGGLQVYHRSGNWIDVITPPEAFVVNIGDMMQRWTNNCWASTLHRVANPTTSVQKQDRQSIVFFHNPNDNVIISCLKSCASPTNPAQYPPILAGEHRRFKSSKSRQNSEMMNVSVRHKKAA